MDALYWSHDNLQEKPQLPFKSNSLSKSPIYNAYAEPLSIIQLGSILITKKPKTPPFPPSFPPPNINQTSSSILSL